MKLHLKNGLKTQEQAIARVAMLDGWLSADSG